MLIRSELKNEENDSRPLLTTILRFSIQRVGKKSNEGRKKDRERKKKKREWVREKESERVTERERLKITKISVN